MASSQLTDGRDASESLAYLTWSAEQAGYYGVQVFDYARNLPVEYTLYCTGLE